MDYKDAVRHIATRIVNAKDLSELKEICYSTARRVSGNGAG